MPEDGNIFNNHGWLAIVSNMATLVSIAKMYQRIDPISIQRLGWKHHAATIFSVCTYLTCAVYWTYGYMCIDIGPHMCAYKPHVFHKYKYLIDISFHRQKSKFCQGLKWLCIQIYVKCK